MQAEHEATGAPPATTKERTERPAEKPQTRYAHDDHEAWLRHLSDVGFVVLSGVASQAQVEEARSLLWDAIEASNTGVDRQDASSWGGWKLDSRGFLLQGNVTQGRGAWLVRGLPAVRAAFARIWKTTELLCSMDSVIAWRPWWSTHADARWMPRTEGLHLDQNPFSKPGFECVQGMVVLYPVDDATGGLELVPGSHLDATQQRIRERCGHLENRGDWCPLPAFESVGASEEGAKPGRRRRIFEATLAYAEPGDLILWDSRTVHGGRVGTGCKTKPVDHEGESEPAAQLARLSLAICMTPRSRADEKTQRIRREGFEKGHTFSHCPHEAHVSACTPGQGFTPPQLTESQRQLL